MIDASSRVRRWCHHREKENIRFLVECREDGHPARYAMGRDHDDHIKHGYLLITPAPPGCAAHFEVEFGLIAEDRFDELYELED